MFNGIQYDSDHMSLHLKRKRLQILDLCPQLCDTQELRTFMQPEGEFLDVRYMEEKELAIGSKEALWSSEDEESEIGDLEDFNR